MKILMQLHVTLLIVLLFGCGSKDDPKPNNLIESSDGLVVNLEWSTGGSSTQAIEDADLELLLLKDNSEVDVSAGVSFEEVLIENHFADGSYKVQVKYYSGSKAVDYTLFVRGASSSDNKAYEGSFLSSDRGLVIDYLLIEKAGSKYTITDL